MEQKKILITGGTGFIGRYLSEELLKQGNLLTIVSRTPKKYKSESSKNQRFISWDDVKSVMSEMDVVINLAGENLFGQRWTDSVKKKIYDSRIESTRTVVDAIRSSDSKPKLLISSSGVNYYGDSGDEIIDETDSPGKSFLSKVCMDWEEEARKAETLGVRVAIPRIAPVLGEEGGMLEKLKLPFILFVGGPVGSGDQYIPWIHMEDICRAILYPISNVDLKGAYNACSPNPATMRELADALGWVLNRPSFFKVPEFAIKLALGEAADPIIGSLRVQPKVLQNAGFTFRFEDLRTALSDIL